MTKWYSLSARFPTEEMEVIDRIKDQYGLSYNEIINVDISIEDKRYVFAYKTQHFYTAIEDLLKQIAKAFENHLSDLSSYQKELLVRLNTEIPNIRPAVLSKQSFLMLELVEHL